MCKYACEDQAKLLKARGFQTSMAPKGNPLDNAQVEGFFRRLKTEEVYLMDYRDRDEAVHRLPVFIESVYNQQRIHSALGYMSPEEFEQTFSRLKQVAG